MEGKSRRSWIDGNSKETDGRLSRREKQMLLSNKNMENERNHRGKKRRRDLKNYMNLTNHRQKEKHDGNY